MLDIEPTLSWDKQWKATFSKTGFGIFGQSRFCAKSCFCFEALLLYFVFHLEIDGEIFANIANVKEMPIL